MIVKGGTSLPACAACKHQRRKCSPACPLAPYFPASQPEMFENVHRLFGVSNVTKTLARIKNKDMKDDAIRSIIYEAEMRRKFPVHGCCFVIAQLYHQLRLANQELNSVRSKIEAYRNENKTSGKQLDLINADSCLDCLVEFGPHDVAPYGIGQLLFNEYDCREKQPPHPYSLSSKLAQMNVFDIQETKNSSKIIMNTTKSHIESSAESSLGGM